MFSLKKFRPRLLSRPSLPQQNLRLPLTLQSLRPLPHRRLLKRLSPQHPLPRLRLPPTDSCNWPTLHPVLSWNGVLFCVNYPSRVSHCHPGLGREAGQEFWLPPLFSNMPLAELQNLTIVCAHGTAPVGRFFPCPYCAPAGKTLDGTRAFPYKHPALNAWVTSSIGRAVDS